MKKEKSFRGVALFYINCAISNYIIKLDNIKYNNLKAGSYDKDFIKNIDDIIQECNKARDYVKENLK